MQDIKAILFDFGGTLDNDGADWFTRLYHIVASRVGPIEREEFDRVALQAANMIGDLDDTCRLSMADTATRLCQRLHTLMENEGDAMSHPWEPKDVVQEFMAQAEEFLERNRSVLEQLRLRYRLGVISNNWGNTMGWCEYFQIDHYMDTIIDSTVVGATKPESKIFAAALDQLKLPAQQCAYVGDRYECDMIGAHQAGLTPIWITHRSTPVDYEEPVPVRRIEKLTELLELI